MERDKERKIGREREGGQVSYRIFLLERGGGTLCCMSGRIVVRMGGTIP